MIVVIYILLLLIENVHPNQSKNLSSNRRKSSGAARSRVDDNEIKATFKKYVRRRPILPTPKESIFKRALKRWDDISKTISSTSRDLKAYFSSDFEALLLMLTSPNENRPSQDALNTIISTIESFARNMDTGDATNPYRVTLHKIWSKLIEDDVYTKLKALLVLHTILRYTEPEDSLIFKSLVSKMSREYVKKSNIKYFEPAKMYEVSVIHDTGRDSEELKSFLKNYGTYVMKRSRAFTSQFEEMHLINKDMRTEDICAQLLKANKLMNAALNCRPTDSSKCDVVTLCVELVARDVKDLFLMYYDKLKWLLVEEEEGRSKDLFSGWKTTEVEAVLEHFKTFYDDRIEDVQEYLDEANALLQGVGLAFPCALDTPKSISNKDSYVVREDRRGSAFVLTEADDDSRDVTESDEDLFDDDELPTIYDEPSSSEDF